MATEITMHKRDCYRHAKCALLIQGLK